MQALKKILPTAFLVLKLSNGGVTAYPHQSCGTALRHSHGTLCTLTAL